MRRGRAMPALIGTIALLAGCGSSGRVEVSGVVRDRATGRVIAGARVVATDGSATRTDASGRFTLSVARGGPSVVRASAHDHVDVTGTIVEGEELDLDLVEATSASDDDPDAIVHWLGEDWVDDALRWSRLHDSLARDADVDDALAIRAAIALLGGSDGAHAGLECSDCHTGDTSRAMRALESDLDAT